jgi:surfeit locus 1 family protein
LSLTYNRSTLLTGLMSLALFVFLLRLGFWQLDRATQKQERAAEYAVRRAAPVVDLAQLDDRDPEHIRWRHVRAAGRYTQPDVLLDNRMRAGQVGFDLLSPFTLANGVTVLVERGWIAAGTARERFPAITTPTSPTAIEGYAGPPVFTGLRLNDAADAIEQLQPGLLRVQRIDLQTLEPYAGARLEPYIVYLDESAAHGYDRERLPPGDGSARHEAYATQWFTMAGILVLIMAGLIFRNKPRVDPN